MHLSEYSTRIKILPPLILIPHFKEYLTIKCGRAGNILTSHGIGCSLCNFVKNEPFFLRIRNFVALLAIRGLRLFFTISLEVAQALK